MAASSHTIVFIQPQIRVATWRTGWPAAELRRRGYDAVLSANGRSLPAVRGDYVTFVLHFVNMSWTSEGRLVTCLDLGHHLKRFGRLVFGFDDDLTNTFELEPHTRPRPGAVLIKQVIPEACRIANKVIVATPRLAEVYSRWGDVEVIENMLPTWVLEMKRPPKEGYVAWMGQMGGNVHGRDWDLLKPYAKDLPPLKMIGTEPEAVELLNKWGARATRVPPLYDQRKYYRELGRARAAIVPLVDTPFTQGKSWIKPMEFMARSVPAVSSWHAEYERLDELTGAAPTYRDPAELASAAVDAYEKGGGEDLPDRLKDAGLTMEQAGGDAWEKALTT